MNPGTVATPPTPTQPNARSRSSILAELVRTASGHSRAMFDLKKRNSLTLNSGGRDVDEFRRVAVRRRAKDTEPESHTAVSSGVCGSYSCGGSCGRTCPSDPDAKPDEDRTSPSKRKPSKPQVPPKPAHLQTPMKTEPPSSSGLPSRYLNVDKSPIQVTCCHTSQNPNKAGLSFLNEAHVSPTRLSPSQKIPKLMSSPTLGSPSPGKRVIRSCSPSRKGGHSPARLSPRNRSPLFGLLKPPSPVQGKIGSYTPTKNSKSWLGLHRIPSGKMDGQEKHAGKSLSVPDLVVYADESAPSNKAADSSSSARPVITVRPPVDNRVNCTVEEVTPGGEERRLRPNDPIRAEKGSKVRVGSKFSCRWTEGTREARQCNENLEKEEELKEENTEQKLFKIVRELLHTERAYVARLHLLDQVFCLRLTEEAGRGSFPAEVVRNIFSNISSIYSFHSQFLLPDLEDCIGHWHECPGLGNVLLQHAPFLRMYADYVRNFDQATELVRIWTERSSAFRNIVEDIQSQEVCASLSLQHHMLEPVQRIPRYEMLLRDYVKKVPPNNPDYEFARQSLQTISMAASHSNSAIHKAESIKRLLEIYEMVGEEEVVNPTNEFLKEGRLLKLAARNASAMERHLFLFNNFLLCCTPKFSLVGQRFTVRSRIGVDGMQVQQTTNEDHPYTFQVSGKEKTLELQASSDLDRDEWIKVIQDAIDVFQKKNETFKLASKELNAEEPAGELGRRAPRWIRDNEVSVCMKCREPFNALTRRRHHCRACGCVVCWKCSDNKAALAYDGNKLNKVCKSCYSILMGQRGGRGESTKRPKSELESFPASCLISSFLQYGDNPKTWQRVWAVIPKTEPPVLSVYAARQDAKPLSCIPMLGCTVEDPPQDPQGQLRFNLRQSKSTHVFTCDHADVKRAWLAALKAAAAPSDDGASESSGEEFVSI
ncbi:FYVE, RhoGEF and PH domain-containing protein 4-like [Syngnathoides biaculeatus]|uniref:FYVE, RhoGEF and PH domain-containing protein 4-like n=1 Tax=Syngnathoides biaculeatus TaxID=300417 RepID=UPI002ADE7FC1|nr:FYVE, RhoGEF and PH domain-containing protein 4-like [Syngnathoides biaculeatus]